MEPPKLHKTLPVLLKGTTAHADATRLMYLEKQEWNEDDIKAKVAISQLGLNLTSEVFKRYNATWPSLTAMISDIRTVCPLLHLAKQIPSTSFYVATEVSLCKFAKPNSL